MLDPSHPRVPFLSFCFWLNRNFSSIPVLNWVWAALHQEKRGPEPWPRAEEMPDAALHKYIYLVTSFQSQQLLTQSHSLRSNGSLDAHHSVSYSGQYSWLLCYFFIEMMTHIVVVPGFYNTQKSQKFMACKHICTCSICSVCRCIVWERNRTFKIQCRSSFIYCP